MMVVAVAVVVVAAAGRCDAMRRGDARCDGEHNMRHVDDDCDFDFDFDDKILTTETSR
jgi:hypothetical protein